MKRLALLVFVSNALFAQSTAPTLPGGGLPPPEKTPMPAAKTSATAVNSAAPVTTPTPTPAPTPTTRSLIDSLSPEELQQALSLLKTNYVKPEALAEPEISRAALQGLVDRLAPGVSLIPAHAAKNAEPNPFRSEIVNDRIGYLRLGDLTKNNVGELDAALKNFGAKTIKAVILDLRATPASSDYDTAAEVTKRFCAKGKLLFTLKKSGTKPARLFTSNIDPLFQGLLVIIVDADTAGAAEVIAAVLRTNAKAMVVGEKTSGQAVEFTDLQLRGGNILRVAISEIVLPDNASIYPNGVKPDIAVTMPDAQKQDLLRAELEQSVASFVTETERVRMNEAALVAGRNPELDAYEAAQRTKDKPKSQLRDVQLQRAIDLVTTIGVYERTPRE